MYSIIIIIIIINYYKRFKRMLIYYDTDNLQIFGVIAFVKLQNDSNELNG